MNEELKPLDNNEFNQELVEKEEVIETKEEDKFASRFPDWDLLPPNQVIRRMERE